MIAPARSVRRCRGAHVLVIGLGCLAACTDGSGNPLPQQDPAVTATLQVISRDPHVGIAGQLLPDAVVVRVVDAQGNGVEDARVHFTATGGGDMSAVVSTDAQGYASVGWTLGAVGEQRATAQVEGGQTVPLHARFVDAPASVVPTLGRLGAEIPWSIRRIIEQFPRNQGIAQYMEAKLALLQAPGLGGDIVETGRWIEGSIPLASGASLPVTAVYMTGSMRGEAEETMRFVAKGLPAVQAFLGVDYPAQRVVLWYGFLVGSAGTVGEGHLEDRTTYLARAPSFGLPFDAMSIHELTHTWMGNESANQFLELYGYNRVMTGSEDPHGWVWTRHWVPGSEENTGIAAILDIYDLIGPNAMASAYRAMIPLRPPYGEPLSAAARQAFVDAAPDALKAQVAAKAARIGD